MLTVHDHPRFLALLRELIGAAAELEPVGEASSGERTIEVVTERPAGAWPQRRRRTGNTTPLSRQPVLDVILFGRCDSGRQV